MGQAAGVAVDADDHIWVIQRPKTLTADEKAATVNPPTSKCCAPAPPVLEFAQDGTLLRSWGRAGPGIRLAADRAWHPYRPERLRMHRCQWRAGWADPEVHERRQIRPAD